MASKEDEDKQTQDIENGNFINGSENELSRFNCNPNNFTLKAEEYLNSDDVRYCNDPKLKREKQKLEDLLKSYKKLINKLDSKFQSEEEKKAEEIRISKVPEIYAVLHPEIYKNTREEEKNKLIQKFSKRQFSPADRVVPVICRTPVVNVHDKRQEEKERFIKIISSCPARFLNTYESPVSPRKVRRPKYVSLTPSSLPNEREAEKERLSKIFATSGIYYRKQLEQKPKLLASRPHRDIVIKNSNSSDYSSSIKESMVRVGEYSPLTSKEKQGTLQGLSYGSSDHWGNRYPQPARNVNNNRFVSGNERKVERGICTNDLRSELDDEEREEINGNGGSSRKRCSSISTQTDPSDILEQNLDIQHKDEGKQQDSSPGTTENRQQEIYYLSPREKLMYDLHGVSHCFPGVSSKISPKENVPDAKLRQAAYAKALKEQIEEKRKLEEERKRREKEEEELMDERMRLQQARLEHELSDEQKKKQDWLAQRQSHEEVLRRKMLEMELEAQELKKMERRKRRDSDNAGERRRDSTPVRTGQTPRSEPSSRQLRSGPERREGLTGESKFDALRLAPLLEADRQNILSSYPTSALAFPATSVSPKFRNGDSNGEQHKRLEKERAEDLLKAPLDFRIDRPPSPPIPAVRTRDILNNNSKLLDDKWQVPKDGKELKRTMVGSERDNILTQLGAFRRQLHQEHVKLEARLQKQQSP